jgi:hypothetical protein
MNNKELDPQDSKKLPQADSTELSTKIKASMPNWVASLGVAAMLIIALQLTFVFQPNQEETIDEELLNNIPSTITEPHWLLRVTFEPSAKWRDISKTLTTEKAAIINGPTSKGLVQIVIPKEANHLDESQAILKRLNAQPSVMHAALND